MLGFIYIMRGLLNGVGDVGFSMVNGFLEVAGRIGFAFLFILILKFGYMSAWYTNGLTWSFVGLMSILRFYFGSWKKKVAFADMNSNPEDSAISAYDADYN